MQNHTDTFSPAERHKVAAAAAQFQSYVRLSIPSRMGTNAHNLDQAIDKWKDPATTAKAKKNFQIVIDRGGGADVFRRAVKAQVSGDPLEIAASQMEVAANVAAAALADHNPIYDEEPEPEPVPALEFAAQAGESRHLSWPGSVRRPVRATGAAGRTGAGTHSRSQAETQAEAGARPDGRDRPARPACPSRW
ncbi:MAG: hypothetical protein WDN06_14465 [Asticcacaulis sp.]